MAFPTLNNPDLAGAASPARSSVSRTIGGRYILLGQLGVGGMGRVHRVLDRLTGEYVALKQITVPAGTADSQPVPTPTQFELSSDPRVTLAREFQAMSTLRHPHILNVIDYGFADGQPYFTMELLENAATILEYGQPLPLADKVTLLVQMLQALIYLHRRGLIHRDLKPGNVLVANHTVKVLDFGLSTDIDQATGTVGTLAYMPPEVLYGHPAGPASDLYAVGVIAYQLFTQQHPFLDRPDASRTLIEQILDEQFKLNTALLPPEVAPIIKRLLAHAMTARYQNAADVIADLSQVIGQPLPLETAATRESFLQAARFVGREPELLRLKAALQQTINGQGEAWLIAGESGVGKSRLVDELRTLALVRGVQVLRSSAAASGGSPYWLWRDILRGLVILSNLSDLEASILQPLVPDIATLIARPVAAAPATLNPTDAQTRLFATVTAILRRQAQPTLLLLEDLQWAGSESLQLIAWLTQELAGRPLLIVGNYRDDERPNLPELLPGMQPLPLRRLANKDIVALSESMLGKTGRAQTVVDLLQRETEGNPFFLVEVVRALAEEAGQLDRIGTRTLPTKVLSGGMAQLIQRRLEQVPSGDRALLQASAVAGRRLDLKMLREIDPATDLDKWLTTCANAAVLVLQDEHWRFAHDKLRDGVLVKLTTDQTRQLHQQVAQALEKVYPDAPEQAAQLTYHWAMAGNAPKEKQYAYAAGREALRSGANQEAVRFLERALALDDAAGSPITEEARLWQARANRRLGQAYMGLGRMVESQHYLEETLRLTLWPVPRTPVRLWLSLLRQILTQVLHRAWPRRFVGTAAQAESPLMLEAVRAAQLIAEVYYFASQKFYLLDAGLKTLNLSENIGPCPELARAYGNMSIIAGVIPLEQLAELYVRLALSMARQMNDLPAMAWNYTTASTYTGGRAQWLRTLEINDLALDLCQQTADKRTLGLALGSRSLIPYHRGQFADCEQANTAWQAAGREIDNLQHQALALTGRAECLLRLGQTDAALARLQELDVLWAERDAQRVDFASKFREQGVRAYALWRSAAPTQALAMANQAMQLIEYVSSPSQAINGDGVADVAEVYLSFWEGAVTVGETVDPALQKATGQICAVLLQYGRVFLLLQARAALWQGMYAWLRGRPQAARRHWQRGLQVAQRLGMPYDEAMIHYQLGRFAETGPGRDQHLSRACTLLAELGCTYDLDRAKAARPGP